MRARKVGALQASESSLSECNTIPGHESSVQTDSTRLLEMDGHILLHEQYRLVENFYTYHSNIESG